MPALFTIPDMPGLSSSVSAYARVKTTFGDQATLLSHQAIGTARIVNERQTSEAGIVSGRETRHREIELQRVVDDAENTRDAVEKPRILLGKAVTDERIRTRQETDCAEIVARARTVEKARIAREQALEEAAFRRGQMPLVVRSAIMDASVEAV